MVNSVDASAARVAPTEKLRFRSLDVFRGLTVCIMIIVNTSGAGAEPFPILSHAKWFGLTLADLVFPAFLFAIGNAMSFGSPRSGTSQDYFTRVLRRAAIIFLLGYLMYWFPFFHQTAEGGWAFNPIDHTRIMGVLQRIALCFLAAAVAVRYLDVRGLVVLSLALLAGYWGALYAFTSPDEALTPLGNIGAQIDRAVLGVDHMYVKGHGYDPEGLFSTLPAIVNVLAGYLAGRFVQVQGREGRSPIRFLLLSGFCLLCAGLAWSLAFPLAKRLWTSSFAVVNIGLDLMLLSGLIAYAEPSASRLGIKFCEVFGRNLLAIYLFSELFVTVLQLVKTPSGEGLYDWVGIHLFQVVVPGSAGALLCAVAYMLACWAFGYVLDRNRILIKI